LSNFQTIAQFQPLPSSYKLLPFRFVRWDDETVFLSNLVGEMIFLSAVQLDALVEHSLSPDDPDYADLRARHFIRQDGEQAPLELLGLKLRTKLQGLANFTSLHIFVVTLRCDHGCPYCQVSRQSEDHMQFDMTQDTADKALELVFRSPTPALKIEFQGGEPLLNFDLIRYIVEQAERRNAQDRPLEFVLATTLSLITPDMLEFCRQHNVLLSTSLDGPQDLHDKNRPRPGHDSHQRFEQGLRQARDALGFDRVSALMTTTLESLGRPQDIVDEYLRLGFQSIFLRPLSPYGFALRTKRYTAYNTERWLDFYKEALGYILDLNKRGIHFVEHYSSILLTKMLTSNDPGFVDMRNPSGAGIEAVVFNYDGDVYASDEARMLREMGDATFKMGNVHHHSYEQVFTAPVLLDALDDSYTLSAPGCTDCAFEPYCGADPVYHHAMFGDVLGRKPESAYCQRNMAMFKHLIGLMREDKYVIQIFRRWVHRC
jgi:His-Xaa-Ser system radical SAM maturase HxsB